MNGQYLQNRPLAVTYAFKKDSGRGERHGTAAERLLAAQNPLVGGGAQPHRLFGERAPLVPRPPASLPPGGLAPLAAIPPPPPMVPAALCRGVFVFCLLFFFFAFVVKWW